jgi:hypothetical protein
LPGHRLPASAEIAREIIDDRDAALEQFRLIEVDLNPGTDHGDSMGAFADCGTKADVHLLVDFENLKPSAADVALIRSGEYRLWVFHGPHQNKFDAALVKAWQPLGGRVDFVQSSRQGKNALDFHIAFKLGELYADQGKSGRRASYVVVSGDGGFDALIEYMRTQGCAVSLAGSIPAALTVPAPKESPIAPSLSQGLLRPSRGIIPAVSQPSSTAVPKKKAVAKAAPAVRSSVARGDVQTIIEELRAHPKNRPADRAALERYIVARLGNKITSGAAKTVVSGLEQQQVVSFDGTKATYMVPRT